MQITRYFSKNFILTSLGTLCSRITGLIRDICLSAILGTSGALSIFLTVFSFVNFPRQIFGESATNAIIIPQTTQNLEQSPQQAKLYSSIIIANIAVILLTFIIIASLLSTAFIFINPAQVLPWQVIIILSPYMLFICISAILTGLLNIKKSFFLPGLAPMIINIFIIIFCLAFSKNIDDKQTKILALSFFVCVASIIQSFLLLLKLRISYQWKITFKPNFKSESWQQFKSVFAPVIISAILLNLSIYIDRGLAWLISENTVSALYFAERLTYLPVGLFGVALATSTLPLISKNFVHKNISDAEININNAFRQMLTLAIPTTIFLIFFKEQTLEVLFLRGNFNQESLKITLNALRFYILGIPAFCLIKIIVITHYSQNNTTQPLYAGILGVIFNLIISLSFITLLGGGAIALGTSLAAYISLLYLFIKLPNLPKITILTKLIGNLLLMAIISFVVFHFLKNNLHLPQNSTQKLFLLVLIALVGLFSSITIFYISRHFLNKIIYQK